MDCLHHLQAQYPDLAMEMNAVEQHTQQAIALGGTRSGGTVIQIPVVVHVVYFTAAQNISAAQIQSQIDVLNEDFRRLNADRVNTPGAFQGVAADCEIEFCLASRDPSGAATSGITRTPTNVSVFNATQNNVKFTSTGGRNAWPRSEYLNIWVAPLSSGLLGYAQFPGGPADTDGVVVTTTAFGRIGNLVLPSDRGRTCTHEVGHWLNLRHIWGDGGCGVDDFVNDTPLSDAPNYGCQTGTVSCNSVDMVQNYMDYSDDACMNLFTLGQKARMLALFAPGGARESLLSSQGCGGTTGPGALFQVNQPRSTLLFGGVSGTASTPAITTVSTGSTTNLAVQSNAPGAGYEVFITASPLVASGQGALVTGEGQIANMNIQNPTLFWANGGAVPNILPFPGNFTVPLTLGAAGTFSLQKLVLTPTRPDGITFSQGCQITVQNTGGTPNFPAGPTTDDGTVTVDLVGPGFNSPVTFYGTTYTQLHVAANGRVVFGSPDPYYEPTILGATTGNPFVGFWTDLDPSLGGSITINSPGPGRVRVNWNNVRYWGEPTAGVTFSIEFDTASGNVILDNLQGISQNPRLVNFYSGQSQFLGLSRGAPGATFGGYSSFAPGAFGGATTGAPMLFDWADWFFGSGRAPTLYTGLNRLVFTPAATGNYSWVGQ